MLTEHRRAWADGRIREALSWLRAGACPILLHGGCATAPESIAHRLAVDVTRVVLHADGRRETFEPGSEPSQGRWKESRRFEPFLRNQELVATLAALRASLSKLGTPGEFRVLALRAQPGWTRTHGTEDCLRVALEASFEVLGGSVGMMCP